MSATIFADTNVLVYARDASEAEKQPRAEAWMRYLWVERAGRLSHQVLQEFYITVTAKLDPGLAPSDAREDIRALFAWQPIPVDHRLFQDAWSLQDRFQLAWWDALIVAAAATTGCRFLLTEDLQHQQVFGDVTVISPFETSPDELDSR